MPGLSAFQLVTCVLNAWFVGFSTRKLVFCNAWFVCFLTRKTCLFSMQPNGFSIRKRMFFKM